jgi:hypothetical protein
MPSKGKRAVRKPSAKSPHGEMQRNAAGARIDWMFTADKARAKMGRVYPATPKESYSLW